MRNFLIVILCIASTLSYSQQESKNNNKWSGKRPDGHAPISVMGDHLHKKGGLMFSYRYMTMDMRNLRQEDQDIAIANAHASYMVAPLDMVMDMHMLGAMYSISDKITIMAMANYLENNMQLQMRNGNTFVTQSSGFGDMSINALYGIFNKNRRAMHAQIGVVVPTGSIENKGVLPVSMGNAVQLPYPMQTGTGSFGTKLGLTYLGQSNTFSWGHQLTVKININNNNQDYKFGNHYKFNNWFAAQAGKNLSVSLRLEGAIMGKITGASNLLNPMMVTTADVQNSGGNYINSGIGLNYLVKNGSLKGIRLATEITTPLYQDLNGIQLKQNYNLTFGLKYAVH